MIRTTSFIIVKDSDLATNMPSHFTPTYGKFNEETERMNMRTWGELLIDPSYMAGHGGTPTINVDGTTCHIIGLHLSASNGDYEYEAAYKYGVDKIAPFGTVANFQEAEQLLNKYQIKE